MCIPITSSFTLSRNVSIVITIGLFYCRPLGLIITEIIDTPATKLLILVWFKYAKNNNKKHCYSDRSRIQNCSYNKHHTHQINKYRLVPKGPNLIALKTNLQILNTHTQIKREIIDAFKRKPAKIFGTRDNLNQRIELRHFFSVWFLKWITCFAQTM